MGGNINPSYISGDANSNNILDLTEIWVYQHSYTLTMTDLQNGQVTNSAVVTGLSANSVALIDTSDSNNPSELGLFDDNDGDGDPTNDPTVTHLDNDNDGVPNSLDLDDDNDGIPDDLEMNCSTTPCTSIDSDNDGVPDHFDLDADNDGIPDLIEAGGIDSNGDGIIDILMDTDEDGLIDLIDNNTADGPNGSSPCAPQPSCLTSSTSTLFDQDNNGTNEVTVDTDNDGVQDFIDLDSDNDGIPDVIEVGGVDNDGNGYIDNFIDNDNDGFNDIVDGDNNNDGTANNTNQALVIYGYNNLNVLTYLEGDADNDGIPNHLDLDADNDGILDIIEAQGTDSNNDGKVDSNTDNDNDGLMDNVDADPDNDNVINNSGLALVLSGLDTNNDGKPDSYTKGDFDNDRVPNFLDQDADNDGILDDMEAQGSACYIPIGGVFNSSGIASTIQNNTNCVQTGIGSAMAIAADITSNSFGLIPNADNDDANTAPDYLDFDTDNDGSPDWIEGFDHVNGLGTANNNALDAYLLLAQNYEAANGNPGHYNNSIDSDSDAIPDWLDGEPTTANNTTLFINMPPFQSFGNSFFLDDDKDGIVNLFDTDQNGMSQRTLTRSDFDNDSDFDWRDPSDLVLLPLDHIMLSIKQIENTNKLTWKVESNKNTVFNVQHSLDGISFEDIYSVQEKDLNTFNFIDKTPVKGANYYRIKRIDNDKNTSYSNTVVGFFNSTTIDAFRMWPNPVNKDLYVQLYDSNTEYTVDIYNQVGQLIHTQILNNTNVSVQKIDLSTLLDGVYHCILNTRTQSFNRKLIIKH